VKMWWWWRIVGMKTKEMMVLVLNFWEVMANDTTVCSFQCRGNELHQRSWQICQCQCCRMVREIWVSTAETHWEGENKESIRVRETQQH
jgi:hypothetical protein